MIFRKFWILFATVLLIGCGNSSGDSDNGSDADAELGALIVKLLECDLVTDGDIPGTGRICPIRSVVVRTLLTGGAEKGPSFSYSPRAH
jgi:hypothetical protein